MIDTYEPTNSEEQARLWSQRLQRRVLRLLLQYDEPLLRNQFAEFFTASQLPPIPLLQDYDRYIRLRMLSNELLDDIMPRIRRQLSMETNHLRLREEAPTRGDIDWQRTLERGWSRSPGLSALQFETRLRQRNLQTPENLFTVALLLAYRQHMQYTLQERLADEEISTQERQLLVSMDERAERELAAPYARLLAEQARQTNSVALAEQVAQHLRPGPNPYRDLLTWWQRFSHFRIGRAEAERAAALASKRSDEKTDAWLYELWLALEWLHLLAQEGNVEAQDIHIATDLLQYTFRWHGQQYRFLYNRQLDTMSNFISAWQHGPSSRPDYTIERARPLQITHDDKLIWREPPVVLDAKYYLGGSDPTNTHAPIKKLLGDMTLLGVQTGILCFPLLPEPVNDEQITRTIRHTGKQYLPQREQTQQIHLVHIQPTMDLALLQQRLQAILDLATAQLPQRPEPTCQGIELHPDTSNASNTPAPHLLLCPKPHIGRNVFDLVDPETDCLKNPLVCHVIKQNIIRPYIVHVTNNAALLQKRRDA